MAEALVLLIVVVAIACFLGVGALWGIGSERLREKELRDWSYARAVRLTPTTHPFTQRYFRTGRDLRFVCIVAGIVLPPMVQDAVWPRSSFNVGLAGIVVGGMVGTLWAELASTRPAPGKAPAASLSPRRLPDYLPAPLYVTLRVAGPVAALAWLLLPVAEHGRDVTAPHTTRAAVSFAVLSVLTSVLVEAAQRWILRRPQPLVDADLVAADDAVRSQSLHHLAGTGIAVVLLLLAAPLFGIGQALGGAAAAACVLIAVACLIAALLFWRRTSHHVWRVTRPVTVAVGTPVPTVPTAGRS